MGMFDTVIPECDLPGLPPPPLPNIWWQTKDFDWPGMDNYRITAAGRLEEEIYHIEDRSDHTAPEGSLARLAGCMSRARDGWRDMAFHGVLNFYSLIDSEWWEYNAKFTDGQLVGVERVSDTLSEREASS